MYKWSSWRFFTKRLHFPQHNPKRPDITLKAIIVVSEVFRRVPAQGHSLLADHINKRARFRRMMRMMLDKNSQIICSPCVVFSGCCVCFSCGSGLWPGRTPLSSPPMGIGSPEYSSVQGHSAPPGWFIEYPKSFFPFCSSCLFCKQMRIFKCKNLCVVLCVIPFLSANVPWPGRCGKTQWWTGFVDQGRRSVALFAFEQNCAACRSSWTPWSAYTALRKQTRWWKQVHY